MSYYEDTFQRQGQEVTVYRNVETGRFASERDVITYVFLWHAMGDACPKCLSLDNREWRDQDLFQNVLWDSIWGDVYDLDAGISLTHPNCRCGLEVRPIMDLMQIEELTELNDMLRLLGV